MIWQLCHIPISKNSLQENPIVATITKIFFYDLCMFKFHAYKKTISLWFFTYTRNRDMHANFP